MIQVAIAMTRPTPHPKTGVYRVRIAIPGYLRETTQRLYGLRSEFIRTLGTKSERDAVKAAPAVIAEFAALRTAADAAHRGASAHLTDHDISALCGQWLRGQEVQDGHGIPASAGANEMLADIMGDALRDDGSTLDAERIMRTDLAGLVGQMGMAIDADSHTRLVRRLAYVQWQRARQMMTRDLTGSWPQGLTSSDFPAALVAAAPALSAPPTVSLEDLLDRWGFDRGWKRSDSPKSRAFYDRERTLARLKGFLKHDDALKITRDDAIRWKMAMQDRKLTARTVRNDLSEVSAMWKWGMAHGLVTVNPFAGVLPPKGRKSNHQRSFTNDEACKLLIAARQQAGALRWLPWLLCFTGARLNEACQAVREDVAVIDGVPTIRIHDESEGGSVKNEDSYRTTPLHPALVSEGFLDYVGTIKVGATLWPDFKPDKMFGRRSGTGGKRVARWLRVTLANNDARISPNHSWRHTFIEACRRVVMPLEVRSAITGHSARMDESSSYGAGMKTMIQVMAEHLARVPSPLAVVGAGSTPKGDLSSN